MYACVFSGYVPIFFEEALDAGGALVDAAAGLDVGLHLLLVVFDRGHFAHDYFLFGAEQQQAGVEAAHVGLHLVLYATAAVVLRGLVLRL